ncbi:hypothetical protein QLQ12_11530 [Actinoplanes sp. NEAU-A12]|uniref:Erythromycin biosynthesis protein CIII-like C-terminal domain-containing protein n=1 Tax=Actinoplanes sandaracinus TaxID=3045177 RepID=A0ABT6WHN1_9ACTN|nr:nucleotide disphospho-sugar-binding domain-containing protein [Actinoplanes sandaracinus]MDI6099226.1 hypothetical protein [Actinoplanes sandaracinus]
MVELDLRQANRSPIRSPPRLLCVMRRLGCCRPGRVNLRLCAPGGWGGLREVPAPDVFLAGEVPHEVVFPRVAVIVHHGGAGTTAAAVRAGRPQVVCPFVGDQPFWGRRMHQLAVAPEPIDQRRLTAPRLAAAIREAIDDAAMTGGARRLGDRVRAENGVAAAVDVLEQVAAGRR